MHPITARTVLSRWWNGVRASKRDTQQRFIPAVFDTETCFGFVFATGFFDGEKLRIHYGDKRNHARWFLDQVKSLPISHGTAVVASHFLIFDLSVLFWKLINPGGYKPAKAPKRSYFSVLEPRCTIEIFWGRPCFGFIRFGNKTIHLVDTYAYYGMSLSRALRAIGAKEKKLKKPANLGRRIIPLSELHPYLAADCHGDFALLEDILNRHREFLIPLCVSAPMMAGKIFRRHFMKKDFAKPSAELRTAGLLSYHGGKNGFYAKPGWHKKAWDLDINSAYAEAMFQLPNFSAGRWRRGSGMGFVRKFPHGVYRIEGTYRACTWGSLFSHDFKRLETGRIRPTWVTGYELLESIRSGEFTPSSVLGFGFQEKKKAPESPFKAYIKHWFEIKRTTTNKAFREFAKHMLTDLYGKFIARIEEEETGDMVAGSMFDPAIASLITGFVRARIHRLEHKYRAIHTATDGFITQNRPDPLDIGSGLGQLKQETFGPVLILRNKLYLHYDGEGRLRKTGLHGFELGPEKLLRLWKSADRTYRVERLVRFAEAWGIDLPPGAPKWIKKRLNLVGV